MHPNIGPLLAVVRALQRVGATCALGGSGLLYSLGLVEQVRDWDLTTDAPFELVREALEPFSPTYPAHGDGRYATGYRLSVRTADAEIDLIGAFAIGTDAGVCHLPAIVSGSWQEVPVGSPEVWAVAYRLMERHPKADLLDRYLAAHGASPLAVDRLLAGPLPPALRAQVAGWPVAVREPAPPAGGGSQA